MIQGVVGLVVVELAFVETVGFEGSFGWAREGYITIIVNVSVQVVKIIMCNTPHHRPKLHLSISLTRIH